MDKFIAAVGARYTEMAKGELFVVDIDGDIFQKYLSFFPKGSDPIYRQRSQHDCVTCKQFIRRLGVLVGPDGKSVWDLNESLTNVYGVVTGRMADYISSHPIKGVFRSKERQYGVEHNYDSAGERYEHFWGKVADNHYRLNPEQDAGEKKSIYDVLKRGLETIKIRDLNDVLGLIDSNTLYRGEEHRSAVLGFRELMLSNDDTDLFIWKNIGHRFARFRNTVIGTLLVDLSEGVELESAVRSFETKVAPINYKRPTAVITQKMVEDAVSTLNELGLSGAMQRRLAKLSDVSVNDVLFVNNNTQLKDNITSLLETSIRQNVINFKHHQPVEVDTFVDGVLRGAKEVKVLVENRHMGNFVSLTAPANPNEKNLFKWNNNFAWSYDGNVTDSVKARVKAAGGNINAKLRISLSWYNTDDLDLHCYDTKGLHIYYGNKAGILDVDMNVMSLVRNPVENLSFDNSGAGHIKVWVNQFRQRETVDTGFSIEVECDGELHEYSYDGAVKGNVDCFTLYMDSGKLVKITSVLKGGSVSKDKWGIKTGTLVDVNSIMWSPNCWSGDCVGARHLIFSLSGCQNPEPVRGIYNEYLRSEFEKHRKVFEVLGSKMMIGAGGEGISGLGFTSARGDSVSVVVDGRPYNVNF